MKAQLHYICAAAVVFLSALNPMLDNAAEAACVVGVSQYADNYLSLRKGPGTRFTEIGRLPNKTNLRILERAGGWRRVRLNNGTEGWVHAKFVGTCEDGESNGGSGTVYHVAGLNKEGDNYLSLRSGPGSKFQELSRMGPDTIVRMLRSKGSWLYVRDTNGQQGWAHKRYLAKGYP